MGKEYTGKLKLRRVDCNYDGIRVAFEIEFNRVRMYPTNTLLKALTSSKAVDDYLFESYLEYCAENSDHVDKVINSSYSGHNEMRICFIGFYIYLDITPTRNISREDLDKFVRHTLRCGNARRFIIKGINSGV